MARLRTPSSGVAMALTAAPKEPVHERQAALWDLANVYLARRDCPSYRPRKIWREGLEVAIKIKGSQGQRRVVWIKPEHPLTAISPGAEVHANHNEAQNAALRRRCSAYRRRQNLYAKTRAGLQRVLDGQRIIHNWVRPHFRPH